MQNRFALSTLTLSIMAQTGLADAPPVLEELIVTSPLHRSVAETAHPVTVISGDALRRKARATLGDTLAGEPGLSSASFGPGVGTPVIRGQSGGRVQVLQDSTGGSDVSSISPDHANTTEALLAERIEVLRGPSTLLYGNGAVGGVVNVIDNRIPDKIPSDATGAVELRHNGASDMDASVFKIDAGSGSLAVHADGFYRESNDLAIPGNAFSKAYLAAEEEEEEHAGEHDEEESSTGARQRVPNTATRTHAGSLGVSWVGERGFIGMAVQRLENLYGIPGGGHVHGEEHEGEEHEEDEETHADSAIRIDMRQTRYSLKGQYETDSPWLQTLRGNAAYTDYEHTELEDGTPATRFSNRASELRLETIHDIGRWHGAVGVQALERDFKATGEEAYLPAANIRSHALFWIEDYHLNDWVFEFGARYENQQISPDGARDSDVNTLSASASALYNLTSQDTLYMTLSRSERALALEELYACGAHPATQSYEIGLNRSDCAGAGDSTRANKEASRNIELGYRRHLGSITAELNLYRNDVDDYVYLSNTGDTLDGYAVRAYSQGQARFHGIEAKLAFPLMSNAWGNFTGVLSGDSVRGELDDGGGDLPRIPAQRATAGLEWQRNAWEAELRLSHVWKQTRIGENELPTEGYDDLDFSVAYTAPSGYMLFLRGRNLLNEEIRNATSFLRDVSPEPGRHWEAGIRWSF